MALRSRRYHKRSRNGCLSCIQRHVRCDEAKPCCGYCLTRGYDCEYRPEGAKSKAKSSDSAAVTLQASEGEIVQWFQSPMISHTILGQMDVFNSLPVNLTNPSIQLLHHFSTYTMHRRELYPIKHNTTHQKWCNFAISDPALLHASLTLAAGNWTYLNGEMVPEYYHHKAEAMRMINQNLADPMTATSDGTVGAIVHLIMAESIYGSADIAAIHLRGLHRLLSIRGDIHSDRISFVLIRLIQMAYLYAECASQSNVRFSHTSEAKILPKKPMEGSLIISFPPKITFNGNVDLAILEIDKLDQGMLDCIEVLRQVSKVSSATGTNLAISDKEYIDTIDFVEKNLKAEVHRLETRRPPPGSGRIIEWHVANNFYWPLSLLLYFYLFVKRIPVGNAVCNDLVRKLKVSLEESKSPHFQRIWPPALVLWMLVIGCVASWGLEEGKWFRRQLVLCRRGIGVTSWEGAEEILGGITWVDGIGGVGAKKLWDELDCEVV